MIIPYQSEFIVPANTSKQEIVNKIKHIRQIFYVLVLGGFGAVFGVLQLFVAPKLNRLYQEFNITPPLASQNVLYILIGFILIFGFFIYKLNSENQKYLSVKTQEGYLKITPLYNPFKDAIVIMAMGLIVGICVFVYILPIYSLTQNF